MSKDHFQLTNVTPLPGHHLRLTYADGQTFEVGLDEWIAGSPNLRPLKEMGLFAQARIGMAGRTVEWIAGKLDLGADNLRNLAIERAGGIGHELSGTGCTTPD